MSQCVSVCRLGAVACGEASLVVAVSSAHRGPALAAAAHCLERLKASAPVWKREHYAGDLAPHWKENPECAWAHVHTDTDNDTSVTTAPK